MLCVDRGWTQVRHAGLSEYWCTPSTVWCGSIDKCSFSYRSFSTIIQQIVLALHILVCFYSWHTLLFQGNLWLEVVSLVDRLSHSPAFALRHNRSFPIVCRSVKVVQLIAGVTSTFARWFFLERSCLFLDVVESRLLWTILLLFLRSKLLQESHLLLLYLSFSLCNFLLDFSETFLFHLSD